MKLRIHDVATAEDDTQDLAVFDPVYEPLVVEDDEGTFCTLTRDSGECFGDDPYYDALYDDYHYDHDYSEFMK